MSDIAAFVAQIGHQSVLPLGANERIVDKADVDFLLERFRRTQKLTNFLIFAAASTVLAVFLMSISIMYIYISQPKVVVFLFGGDISTLMVATVMLRRLWMDKVTVDILTVIIAGMSPREAAKTLTTFYFQFVAKSRVSIRPRLNQPI